MKMKPAIAAVEMRRRAEAKLSAQPGNQLPTLSQSKSDTDTRRLLHELQVHQIELELQNEELTQAKIRAEGSARKFSDLYDFAPIGYVSLDGEGRIQELNFTAAKLLGRTRSSVAGKLLVSYLAAPHQDNFRRHLLAASETDANLMAEVELRAQGGRSVPVQLCTLSRAGATGTDGHFLVAITDITALKRVETEIRQLNAGLEARVHERTVTIRKLATELGLAEHRDKARLAYALHEDLQQLLVAMNFDLQALAPHCVGQGKKLLRRAKKTLSKSVEFTRDLSVELSPPILAGEGLAVATEWLAHWMRNKHGLDVQVTIGPNHVPLPEEISVILYQVLRELLLNIVQHTHVSSARVTLDWLDSEVRVVVSDTGNGFDPAELQTESFPRKFGLFTARERVGWLDGQMEIESAPGRGSRFTLRVPLRGPQAGLEKEVAKPVALRVNARAPASSAAATPKPTKNGRRTRRNRKP